MAHPLMLLPDFLLIALGYLICRHTALDRPVWDGVERLVYYVLFPALLFNSIVRQPIHPGDALALASGGWVLTGVGIALAYALALLPGVDRRAQASGAQVAYRFNSYIALALAERLGGQSGVASMALLIAVCVPVANVAAVWPMARQGGQALGRELVRNPLILSTVSGLVANQAGLVLPEPVSLTLQRVGSAALPLGLMAVGAGLGFGALRDQARLAGALLAIRHVVLPVLAVAGVARLGLPAAQQLILVAFAALPTSASAYVLAARMGGNAPFVAGLVTLSTLIGMLGLPLALWAWQRGVS